MGICFFCPNGHPLNVKAELAGRVGLCPKCHVKMRIPLQSMREIDEKDYHGQPTAEAVTHKREERSGSEKKTKTPDRTEVDDSSSVASEKGNELTLNELIRQATEGPSRSSRERGELLSLPSSSELLSNPDFLWWVVTPDGQRYGPAQGPVLQTWINERRVGPKMKILRNGWKESHEVGEVFPEIANIFEKNGSLVSELGVRKNGGESSVVNRPDALTGAGIDSLVMLRRRQKRAIGALYLIGFLTFVLIGVVGVLIWLLLR